MVLLPANISRIFCTTGYGLRIVPCDGDTTNTCLQVLNGKFCEEFTKIEADLEKEGDANPLNVLYTKSEATELGQAEKRVRARLASLHSQ